MRPLAILSPSAGHLGISWSMQTTFSRPSSPGRSIYRRTASVVNSGTQKSLPTRMRSLRRQIDGRHFSLPSTAEGSGRRGTDGGPSRCRVDSGFERPRRHVCWSRWHPRAPGSAGAPQHSVRPSRPSWTHSWCLFGVGRKPRDRTQPRVLIGHCRLCLVSRHFRCVWCSITPAPLRSGTFWCVPSVRIFA